MLAVRCLFVGLGWNDILYIEPHQDVAELIEKLRESKSYAVPADYFTLFLAKEGPKRTWFPSTSPEYKLVREHELPRRVEDMLNEENKLNVNHLMGDPALGFPVDGTPDMRGKVHVLVVLKQSFKMRAMQWLYGDACRAAYLPSKTAAEAILARKKNR